jgi:hypothetical protein
VTSAGKFLARARVARGPEHPDFLEQPLSKRIRGVGFRRASGPGVDGRVANRPVAGASAEVAAELVAKLRRRLCALTVIPSNIDTTNPGVQYPHCAP